MSWKTSIVTPVKASHVSRVFLLPIIVYMLWCPTTACKVVDPLACGENGKCDDPDRPFCDQWGVYEESNGIGNTCIPEPKQAYCLGDADYCVAGVHHSCKKESFAVQTECQIGCAPYEPRCLELVPSGGDGFDFGEMLPVVGYSLPIKIDTDLGLITESDGTSFSLPTQLIERVDGESVAFRRFWVESWSTTDVEVVGNAALVIFSRGPFESKGIFDIGQAGMATESICGPDAWGRSSNGGGFGAAGGVWRAVSEPDKTAESGDGALVPLRGGCGERAGGALQVSSLDSIKISSGYINASGYGGRSWFKFSPGPSPWVGPGGSGGAILLEAPVVSVAAGAGVIANGGSGGCTPTGYVWAGTAQYFVGARSTLSDQIVDGPCVGAGHGGAAETPEGGDTLPHQGQQGRPGGAVGRIRINVLEDTLEIGSGGVISPTPVIGKMAVR